MGELAAQNWSFNQASLPRHGSYEEESVAPAEADTGSRPWSIIEGTYDPNLAQPDPTRIESIKSEYEYHTEDARQRLTAGDLVVYAVELTMPYWFVSKEQVARIQSDVERSVVPCSYYSIAVLNQGLKELTPELDPQSTPVMAALQEMINKELIEPSVHDLGQGTVRHIRLRQQGRDSDIPSAYPPR